MATQQSNKARANDTILINIMYTGDYTNKNIGHEIINLYKTDEGENYIYISPYGKLHNSRYGGVKAVLLARPAEKNKLEIIAKAEDLKQFNKDIQEKKTEIDNEFYNEKHINPEDYKYFLEQILKDNDILYLDGNEVEQKFYCDWLVKNYKNINKCPKIRDIISQNYQRYIGENEWSIKTITDKFLMNQKILTQKQIRNIQQKFIIEQLLNPKNHKTILEKTGRSRDVQKDKLKFCNNGDNYKNIKEEDFAEIKKYCDEINRNKDYLNKDIKNNNKISKLNKDIETLKNYAEMLKNYGNKEISDKDGIKTYFEDNTHIAKDWKNRRILHNHHMELIANNNINYGDQPLNEIIKDNQWDDVNAHFTFKAAKVSRPTKSIYIEYTSPNKSDNEDDKQSGEQTENEGSLTGEEQTSAEYIGEKANETSITFMFKNIKFRNQSCMKYVTYRKQDFLNKLEKMSKKYEDLNEIIQSIKENSINYDENKKELADLINNIIKDESDEKNLKDKKYLNNILNSKEDEIYKKIQKEILDSNLWEKPENSTTTVENDNDSDYEQFFLDITGNQYDELAYSNMFAHFFKNYPDLFVDFVGNTLSKEDETLKNFENSTIEVLREENNIDLLIETEKDVFVIENKVKSNINGEKYIDAASKNTDNSEENNETDSTDKKDNIDETDKKGIEYTNQLIKYYNYVESKYPDKNKHYFIFKPNYNDIKAELDEKIENASKEVKEIIEKYKHINYSDIYNFYIDKPKELLKNQFSNGEVNKENEKGQEDSIKYTEQILTEYVYFNDFVKALKRHINSTDNTNELLMKYKFNQAIKHLKNESPRPNLTGWYDKIIS